MAAKPYNASDHVLAPFALHIAAAAAELAPLVTEELLTEVAADRPRRLAGRRRASSSTMSCAWAYVAPLLLLARAATIHERITLYGAGREPALAGPGLAHRTPATPASAGR
ncbi:HipA-like kinase domain-containing protein OS=Streptomyces microflavus OX=1919 GN=G3I39_30145 PE=4 SV=1 [Streptomyces microflavus]